MSLKTILQTPNRSLPHENCRRETCVANVLLALGASPIMTHAHTENDEISQKASALLLNIGTLEHNQIAFISSYFL